MMRTIGKAAFVFGIASFFVSWLAVATLEGKVRSFPLSPNFQKGFVFAESAGRGSPKHYVPIDLHRLVALSTYAIWISWAVGCLGYFLKDRAERSV